ncbi:MAG: glucosamine-6-phosphate deaminase [Verrucomicrobiota bacterium]|nr:glucosamine-6-phosphate deaminase [Verrucomicrobiota bacterium]
MANPTPQIPQLVPIATEPGSRFERIPVTLFANSREASRRVALEFANLIRAKQMLGQTAVLGLATGSTPIGVYQELVRMHREEGLSFRNVVTFNLDEYFPISATAAQSYRRFMTEHLFAHIDIPDAQIHIPDGTVPPEGVAAFCTAYEQAIVQAGGIDIQILGIGRTGHIGFNEPGSLKKSLTRLIKLDDLTRRDAAKDFQGVENVPTRAITMGVKSILNARRVFLLAFGEHKAAIIRTAVEGDVTSAVTASFLQEHDNACFILDIAAAQDLTRVKTPWLAGSLQDNNLSWDAAMTRRAVTWLALKIGRPILKLTDRDYNENGLHELLNEHGPAYDLNLQVFRSTQGTITGWPGGKAGTGVFPKRVLIFTPHPDDGFISMGGTLRRLAQQGHEVHFAIQTNGCGAVGDDIALRYVEFQRDYAALQGENTHPTHEAWSILASELIEKTPATADSPSLRALKGLVRRGEARAAARIAGIPIERLHFLEMPFYLAGGTSKRPVESADIAIIHDLLTTIQPHQIYAAGDLGDPHGTHRLALEALERTRQLTATQPWASDCAWWLYRSPWQEWAVHEIDMAVPLSPDELATKIRGICQHQSQRTQTPLATAGENPREVWQQAETANHATSAIYDKLGLAEYEAIEAFKRWLP